MDKQKMDINEKVSLIGAIISTAVLVVVLIVIGKSAFTPAYSMITILAVFSTLVGWNTYRKARKEARKNQK